MKKIHPFCYNQNKPSTVLSEVYLINIKENIHPPKINNPRHQVNNNAYIN